MESESPRSTERIGFAAMAALILAPLLFQPLWLLLAHATCVQVDARWLTLAALLVTTGVVAVQAFWPNRATWMRFAVPAVLAIGAAALAVTSWSAGITLLIALLLLAGMAWLFVGALVRKLPADLDGLARQNKLKTALFVLISAFSIFQTSRVSTFMGDAKRMEYSAMPDIEFLKNHSCLTAYVQAVKYARSCEANLYDAALWPDELELTPLRTTGLARTGPYAPFFLDNYMYPPQFLLLPGGLLGWTDDFNLQRALWFGFCGLLLAFGFWMAAMWVGTQGSRHALWLLPLLWSSLVILVTLQVGNVHHVVMAMALVAMVAFAQQKPVWGGALLAFAILAKISPGILVIVLLAQRRWRDLAWTAAWGVAFTLLTLICFGIAPVESFLTYQLPRLLSGDSMNWFTSSDLNVLTNSGPFSIPFKLKLLGIEFDNIWGVARTINSAYTLALVGATVWASLRKRGRLESLGLWLGVLMLSSLQSPFSPGYVIMPVLWLLSLMSVKIKRVPHLILFIFLWFTVAFPIPGSSTFNVIWTLVQQAIVMGIIVYGLLMKEPEPELRTAQ